MGTSRERYEGLTLPWGAGAVRAATELPDFWRLPALCTWALTTLPTTRGLGSLARLRRLESLAVVDGAVTAADLEPLVGHPPVQRVHLKLADAENTQIALAMLDVESIPGWREGYKSFRGGRCT